MHLTPTERDRLLLFTAAELARVRRGRGLLLNVPEATALVADAVCEAARSGARLAEALAIGRAVLTRAELLPGAAEVIGKVTVEAVFDDGTRLAVVTDPFGPPSSDPAPDDAQAPGSAQTLGPALLPGQVLPGPGPREPERPDLVTVTVTNTAGVPISVTSHLHFFEANPRLDFDRRSGYGRHLAIAAGTAQRFDPGTTTSAVLTPIGGERVVIGFAGLVDGPLDAPGALDAALSKAAACGYLGADQPVAGSAAAESGAVEPGAAESGAAESGAAEPGTSRA